MQTIINNNNLLLSDIEEYETKIRAILFDDNNRLLVANYNGAFLLPGGSIENEETIIEALLRELEEETGYTYDEDELTYFTCLAHFQKNYPKTNGTFKNRLIETYFFIGKNKGVLLSNQKLTPREQKDHFKLEFLTIDEIYKLMKNNTTNPRSKYFESEISEILQIYLDNNKGIARTKK